MKGYLKTIAVCTFIREDGVVLEMHGIRKIESMVFSESSEIETLTFAEIRRRVGLWRCGSRQQHPESLAPGKYRVTLSVVPVDMQATPGSAVFSFIEENNRQGDLLDQD